MLRIYNLSNEQVDLIFSILTYGLKDLEDYEGSLRAVIGTDYISLNYAQTIDRKAELTRIIKQRKEVKKLCRKFDRSGI